jgi:hypothetical protein
MDLNFSAVLLQQSHRRTRKDRIKLQAGTSRGICE